MRSPTALLALPLLAFFSLACAADSSPAEHPGTSPPTMSDGDGDAAMHAPDASTPPSPRTCAEVAGTASGVYTLELGGLAVRIYCDLDTDGGGWALVANAPAAGYSEVPVVTEVDPATHGRLSDEAIAWLLARPSTDGNNVRVRVGESWAVSMRVTLELVEPAELGPDDAPSAPIEIQPLVARVPWDANGDCSAFDDGPDLASTTPAETWSFANGSDGGSVGFSESGGRDGQTSFFHLNYDTGVDRACNRPRTDGAWQPAQAGSLWVR